MTALPQIINKEKLPVFFPSDWQTVIFRNYGLVSDGSLAKILNTDEKTIKQAASDLGLSKITFNGEWLKRGYVTIIRNNWHLLSYRQITQLLNIDESKLAFILKEDDFLDVKLGNFKPYIEEPEYYPLDEKQQKQTKKIKETVESNYIPLKKQSFEFFDITDKNEVFDKAENGIIKDRIIYSYFALYGDSLSGDIDSYPDYLLEKYAKLNINGIWLQGLLNQLSLYPFDKKISEGYEKRRENLNKLIIRCQKYGIKVYVYMNEPRGMDDKLFEKNPDIKGEAYENLNALCTSKDKVKDYLYNAVKDLLKAVPGLGGIITITMSENPTHCYSRKNDCKCNCIDCKERNVEEIAAEVNNIFYRGINDSGSKARLIANLWGWDGFMGWDLERTKRGIDLLDKNIDIMCVSENSMEINKGGVKNTVIDYSISNVGPSERSELLLKYAKTKGHKIFAKVQINNSWECSAVPYIPVFNLIEEHINNLKELNIDGLMLSWTLGGFPGGNLSFLSQFYGNDKTDTGKWYKENYGNDYITVKKTVFIFSEAFTEFPFDLNFLYYGPHNMGCANLWYLKKTGYKATMVGFPYDDIDSWRGVFDKETLTNQLKKLSEKWGKGLLFFDNAKYENKNTEEIKNIAVACYTHFFSAYLQCEFNIKKEQYDGSAIIKKELCELIDKEIENVNLLYKAVSENACIGFEASNHYYYNGNTLLEKIINLNYLKNYLSN